MLKIGLTGGIGCGKSVVSASFSQAAAYIFVADEEEINQGTWVG